MVTPAAPAVWMVDPTGKPKGTIAYTEWTAVAKHLDVGTWQLVCPLTARHAQAAAAGWRVLCLDPTGIYGGPVGEAEITLDTETRRPLLTLRGYDENLWLAGRVAWPKPSAALSAQTDAYHIVSGPATTVMTTYVSANLGPTAQTARRLAGLSLAADPAAGATVVGRARFDPLLDLLRSLAISGGVGCRIRPTGLSADRVFETYIPRDLTGPARFSLRLGNVRALTWRLTAPQATTVIGGGRGEEAVRQFVGVTDVTEENGWFRREAFHDYRSASDADALAELTQATSKRRTELAATRFAEVEPVDSARYRFGQALDYWLGDLVTVDVYGSITMDAMVREAEISVRREAGRATRTVTPRVGDVGATRSPREWQRLADALARLGALERR